MKSHWVINRGALAIENEDGVFFPSSAQIYNAANDVFDGSPSCIQVAGNPRTSLPNIRFSSMPSPLRVELISDSSRKIVLRLYTIKRGQKSEILLVGGKIVDHCIIDGVWFSVSGNIESLEELFHNASVSDSGPLTIKQYVKIVEAETFSETGRIENCIDISELKDVSETLENAPSGLNATLFQYQEVGFNWLRYMMEESEGCILGDEMGLGKTMQVIATMLDMKAKGEIPMLVIAPVSLLANWQRECSKFAPSLSVYLHYGGNRSGNYRDLEGHDVVLTAYSTAVSDIYMLNMVHWQLVTLDEAQNIKNPYSGRTKACKALNRQRSIAVTGTPFENHMTDIWSIMDFVLPGIFGSLQSYQAKISDDAFGGQLIEPILSPLMLRRRVDEVARDLPDKVISSQPIIMSAEEAQKYNQYLKSITASSDSDSVNLGMLQKLRMYCTHPFITEDIPDGTNPYDVSIKYQRFCELLGEILERREKVLVFTSYKRMFDIFMSDIQHRFGIPVWCINGETPVKERQDIVDCFNELDKPAALILNPRAAGVGLNITGANHVIHYNLEWNPALEDQSSARAHRRGQEKTVFVYRLYYENTVEQVVNERIERKRDTAAAAIIGNEGVSMDRQDIIRALELFPKL